MFNLKWIVACFRTYDVKLLYSKLNGLPNVLKLPAFNSNFILFVKENICKKKQKNIFNKLPLETVQLTNEDYMLSPPGY